LRDLAKSGGITPNGLKVEFIEKEKRIVKNVLS
jgi:hypothetical protein